MFSVTCVAPLNLAIVKTWTSERDPDLHLPMSCTFGMTIDTEELYSKTTVAASGNFKENRIWYSFDEMSFEGDERLMRCIKAIQKLASKYEKNRIPIAWNLHIVNQNTFPIFARFDVNGPRYASIVFALARLYGLPPWEEISTIARLGSGSACRSLYGGFVHWYRGFRDDGTDCIGIPAVPANRWPDMHCLMLIVKRQTLNPNPLNMDISSDYLNYRFDCVVPDRIKKLSEAVKAQNFEKFANITMRESNWLHSNLNSQNYMNTISNAIVLFVNAYNEAANATRVAYSFDLGPNAFLYVLAESVPHLVASLKMAFPYDDYDDINFIKGIPISEDPTISPPLLIEPQTKNSIVYIIHTKIGEGPQIILDEEKSLIRPNGFP